jgi:hypothetical protein
VRGLGRRRRRRRWLEQRHGELTVGLVINHGPFVLMACHLKMVCGVHTVCSVGSYLT